MVSTQSSRLRQAQQRLLTPFRAPSLVELRLIEARSLAYVNRGAGDYAQAWIMVTLGFYHEREFQNLTEDQLESVFNTLSARHFANAFGVILAAAVA